MQRNLPLFIVSCRKQKTKIHLQAGRHAGWRQSDRSESHAKQLARRLDGLRQKPRHCLAHDTPLLYQHLALHRMNTVLATTDTIQNYSSCLSYVHMVFIMSGTLWRSTSHPRSDVSGQSSAVARVAGCPEMNRTIRKSRRPPGKILPTTGQCSVR